MPPGGNARPTAFLLSSLHLLCSLSLSFSVLLSLFLLYLPSSVPPLSPQRENSKQLIYLSTFKRLFSVSSLLLHERFYSNVNKFTPLFLGKLLVDWGFFSCVQMRFVVTNTAENWLKKRRGTFQNFLYSLLNLAPFWLVWISSLVPLCLFVIRREVLGRMQVSRGGRGRKCFFFCFFCFFSWLLWSKKKTPVSHVACFCVFLRKMSSYFVPLWFFKAGARVVASHNFHQL